MKHVYFLISVIILLLVTACIDVPEGEMSAARFGWRIIPGAEGTTCSGGTPFQYFVRDEVNPDQLAIYFQAGGACWNYSTCTPGSLAYDPTVTDQEIDGYRGVFDFDNPENPMTDYDWVFIPACSADVHAGNAIVQYQGTGGRTRTIDHNGAYNVQTVLDWVYEHYDSPEKVVVIGSSAGALGSWYWFPEIEAHYPDSELLQFADGFIGVMPEGWKPLETWNVRAGMEQFFEPAANLDYATFSATDLYTMLLEAYPENQFGIYSHAADSFQITYDSLAGGEVQNWHILRDAYLALLAEYPNFSYYIGDGILHTILPFDEFYSMTVDNVLFRDWFTDYLAGIPVPNLHCETGTVSCP